MTFTREVAACMGHPPYTYDAESRLVAVDGGGCPTCNTANIYDAEGRRVHSDFSSGYSADLLFDLNGQKVAFLGPSGELETGEVFAAGRDLASYIAGTTLFAHDDWLGTKRARSAVDGTPSGTCTGLPFGDGINCTGTGQWTQLQFAKLERDWQYNLDHAEARFYSPTMGRWTSPDWSAAPTDVP